jgi:CubicO group peptidase (beta-lactamase class C family)
MSGGSGGAACTPAQLAALEQDIRGGMDAAVQRGDLQPRFTLMLETSDGRTLEYSAGGSSPDAPYESASTSKWVTATVILEAVDRGFLTLGTPAHDLLPFWTETTVTLRHLLSFTSGLNDTAGCTNLPNASFATCVQQIYANVWPGAAAAGAEFNYNQSHLQVAGLMAINASAAASWADLFAGFRTRTGLFPNSSYNLPSETNPRLAGGMTWTARDYQAFLRKLANEEVLSAATRAAMFANQRGSAVVTASPALDAGLFEDWSYGLGNWLECPTATNGTPFNCAQGGRNSSAGAYGSYPFIDVANQYFGILAQQGPLGSGFKGVESFRPVEGAAARWALQRCD